MARRAMTPEDLWAIPRVGAPAPSPDGRELIVPVTTHSRETDEATTQLWWRSLAGDGAPRALTAADVSSSSPAWSPDGASIAFVRKPGDGNGEHGDRPQLHVMPLDGGEPQRVTDLPLGVADPQWFPRGGNRIAFLAGVHRDAPSIEGTAAKLKEEEESHVSARVTEDRFYRAWDRWLPDGRIHHVLALDLDRDETLDLTPDLTTWMGTMEPSGQYEIAPDGRELVFGACRTKPPHDPMWMGVFRVRIPARIRAGATVGAPRDVTPKECPTAALPRVSPDGRWILFGAQPDTRVWAERMRLFVHDRQTRRTREVATRWSLHPLEWRWSEASDAILLLADVEGSTGLFRLPLKGALARPGTTPKELARGGSMGALRPAGGRLFVTRATLSQPPEVHSLSKGGGDRRAETSFTHESTKGLALGRTQDVVFDGADGAPVQMFLVHPSPAASPKRRRKRPPLVHLIHGGPHSVFGDQWHWRWNAQVVAAQGYLVAMVNFHGSTGWGQAFRESIVGAWGDKPYRDVMAATDWLVQRKLVDEARMAATGGSYGGYLSCWIASQTDRFACIVNHAGVCDLMHQWASDIPQGWHHSAGGTPWESLDAMERYSPIRHASGFRSPMLVLHGELDYRVPYYQALEIYNVYKAMGRPARLVCYPDENHWILRRGNNVHWYGEVLGWLERWVGRG